MLDIDTLKREWRLFCKDDMFGFKAEVILPFLIQIQLPEQDWRPAPLDEQFIISQMREYMDFAWTKVIDHRGISASSSVEKMQAYLWILQDSDLLRFAQDNANYAQYGAPVLYKICEKYKFPIPDHPSIENMRKGLPCDPECVDGCGR